MAASGPWSHWPAESRPAPSCRRGNRDDLQANFTARWEDGDDAWCGQNFRDNGWPLTARVFAYTDCLPTPATACVLFQQDYTHFFTAFYNQEAPVGYSVLAP